MQSAIPIMAFEAPTIRVLNVPQLVQATNRSQASCTSNMAFGRAYRPAAHHLELFEGSKGCKAWTTKYAAGILPNSLVSANAAITIPNWLGVPPSSCKIQVTAASDAEIADWFGGHPIGVEAGGQSGEWFHQQPPSHASTDAST